MRPIQQQALTPEDKRFIYTILLGVILPLLDTTLMNLALPDIGALYAVAVDRTQWVITAYSLAAVSAIPLAPWLMRRCGASKLWLTALATFLVSTVFAAIAGSIMSLIVARIVQGCATGLLLPTMQTLVVAQVGQNKSRAALAAMSVPSVLAPILAPLFGGGLLHLFSWRALLWLQVPLCLAAFFCSWQRLRCCHIRCGDRAPFDFIGFAGCSTALVCFIYGLSTPTSWWAWGGNVLLVVLLVRHIGRRRINFIDFTVFRDSDFCAASWLLLCSSAAYYGAIFLIPLYFIDYGHYSTVVAGGLVALHGFGMLWARYKLTFWLHRFSEQTVTRAAIMVTIVASAVLAIPACMPYTALLAVAMVLRGGGIGILTIMAMSGAYTGLDTARIADASAFSRMVTYTGASIGVAVVAWLLSASRTPPTALEFLYAHLALIVATVLCFLSSTFQR